MHESLRARTKLGFLGQPNAHMNVDKLRRALNRFNDASERKTIRQVVALISLGIFLAHTIGVSVRDHFDALRHYARICRHAVTWDDEYRVMRKHY